MLQKSPLDAYFPARDLNRARRFYEETLGLVPKSLNNGGVTYELGGGTAAFLLSHPQRRHLQGEPGLLVGDDVDREIAELKERGVVFERTTTCRASAARRRDHRGRRQGRVVQGHRRQHPGNRPAASDVRTRGARNAPVADKICCHRRIR